MDVITGKTSGYMTLPLLKVSKRLNSSKGLSKLISATSRANKILKQMGHRVERSHHLLRRKRMIVKPPVLRENFDTYPEPEVTRSRARILVP
jgi:hypothetical protein